MDVAYVGAKGTGGYAALDINAPQTIGVGNAGRPYASMGRLIRIDSWGQRLKTDYDSLQIAVNKPFTHGLLFKGAYTLAKAMNQIADEAENDPEQLKSAPHYTPVGRLDEVTAARDPILVYNCCAPDDGL